VTTGDSGRMTKVFGIGIQFLLRTFARIRGLWLKPAPPLGLTPQALCYRLLAQAKQRSVALQMNPRPQSTDGN
jgi:hypothetical protein